MEILDNNQISSFIESSGDEGVSIKDIVHELFPEFDDSIESAFGYIIDGEKANIDDLVFRGNELKIIPKIAGGFK